MMSPHKQKHGTTFRIDRRYVGVGRIARSSGTDSTATHKRILGMLDGLHSIGRLDLLKDIRDGVRAPLVVLHFYERGLLDKLPTAATSGDLVTALQSFLDNHDAGTSYKANLKSSIKKIGKFAGKSVPVADLPSVVRTAKEKMRATPVAFNRLRSHMLSFAAEVQGEMSPLWVEVMRIKRFKKAEGKRPHALLRRPLTVAELDKVCATFTDHRYKAGSGHRVIRGTHMAQAVRFLATTGMRPAEYWQRGGATWKGCVTYVDVQGTKTAASVRPTFFITEACQPPSGEQFFRKAFADATTKALRVGLDLYSLRRTFAKLCEDAGVVESRREAYMGHGPQNVGDLYLQTNVLPFVREDGKKVRQWMESERSSIKTSITLVREG